MEDELPETMRLPRSQLVREISTFLFGFSWSFLSFLRAEDAFAIAGDIL